MAGWWPHWELWDPPGAPYPELWRAPLCLLQLNPWFYESQGPPVAQAVHTCLRTVAEL